MKITRTFELIKLDTRLRPIKKQDYWDRRFIELSVQHYLPIPRFRLLKGNCLDPILVVCMCQFVISSSCQQIKNCPLVWKDFSRYKSRSCW